MGLKKKMKAFFTLKRRANDGFTLVELIVVIAILAILAGVGSAGYAGYIKASNKGNDKVLVGNIMRAIETGTYSTMFVPSESLQISATSYPVGFVVLSADGTNLLTSGTSVSKVEGECVFQEIEGVLLQSQTTISSNCFDSDNTRTVTAVSQTTIRYCTTHTTVEPQIVDATGTYLASATHSGENKDIIISKWCKNHKWTEVNEAYPANSKIVSNQTALYLEKANGLCEYAYANQNGIFTGSNVVNGANGNPMDTTHPLYTSIQAAYGDLSNLKLSYDGWTADEGINFATFYSAAPGVMSTVETLSGVLAWASNTVGIKDYVEGEYANSEEVLSSITDKVLTTHDEDSWMEAWNSAGDKNYGDYGFNLSGRENYSAVRVAYNNGFASYMLANGIDDTYANVCKNYSSIEIAGVGLPQLVCTEAFTNDDSGLKDKFKKAGDTDGSQFAKAAELFEQYKNSEACAENGRVFYDTMITFDQTEEFATDKNNIYGGDMFDYYNAYVNEISALYGAAQNYVKDGSILIIVSVEGNELNFQVSPSAANPRPAED